jgi:hypothetical protein
VGGITIFDGNKVSGDRLGPAIYVKNQLLFNNVQFKFARCRARAFYTCMDL